MSDKCSEQDTSGGSGRYRNTQITAASFKAEKVVNVFLKSSNYTAVTPAGLTQVPREGARHTLGGGSCSGELGKMATEILWGRRNTWGEEENFVERASEIPIVSGESDSQQHSKV